MLSRRSSEPVTSSPVVVKVKARIVVAWAEDEKRDTSVTQGSLDSMHGRTGKGLDELMRRGVEEADLPGVRSVRQQSTVWTLRAKRPRSESDQLPAASTPEEWIPRPQLT